MRPSPVNPSNSCFGQCLLLVIVMGAGCSGADLGSSTNTGQNPLGTGSTGGATNTSTSVAGTGGSSAGSTSKSGTGGASIGATGGAGSTGALWAQLYTNYFAGNCASCHGSGTAPAFNSASTMCSALKSAGYIKTGSATLQNLLTWFGGTGTMPLGGGTVPASAVSDITAWQNAGAVCQ